MLIKVSKDRNVDRSILGHPVSEVKEMAFRERELVLVELGRN
jgi:hypothetical protein